MGRLGSRVWEGCLRGGSARRWSGTWGESRIEHCEGASCCGRRAFFVRVGPMINATIMRHMLRVDHQQTFPRALVLTVVGSLLGPALIAQSKPAPVIGAIHASGQKRFSESQVVSPSGLQRGQTFDVTAMQSATQKLGRSGAFEEVQFNYLPEN